jgi:RNA polymerase sigma factor (sigma-70 family)
MSQPQPLSAGEVQVSDLTRLYEEHARPLHRFLRRRTRDAGQAEDLLAETFERALKAHAGSGARPGAERAWLRTIALNALRDAARRSAAEHRAYAQVGRGGEAQDDPALPDAVGRREALLGALEALPEAEQRVLALRFGSDLSLEDVAAAIGEPRSTAESRIYSGLRRLRAVLGEDFRAH